MIKQIRNLVIPAIFVLGAFAINVAYADSNSNNPGIDACQQQASNDAAANNGVLTDQIYQNLIACEQNQGANSASNFQAEIKKECNSGDILSKGGCGDNTIFGDTGPTNNTSFQSKAAVNNNSNENVAKPKTITVTPLPSTAPDMTKTKNGNGINWF